MEVIDSRHWTRINVAAKRGDPAAQWELGLCHHYGANSKSGVVWTEVNLPAARAWYHASATQGYVAAQNALSVLLSSGGGMPPDFALAIGWAKKAVAQGDASAAFNLGTIYRDLGKPRLALRWYQRAVVLGDADAFLQVGLCHLLGVGVKHSFDNADIAFRSLLASEPMSTTPRSRENAHYWLSVLHLMRGPRTKVAIAKARAGLRCANADGDHEQANDLLSVIGRSGSE